MEPTTASAVAESEMDDGADSKSADVLETTFEDRSSPSPLPPPIVRWKVGRKKRKVRQKAKESIGAGKIREQSSSECVNGSDENNTGNGTGTASDMDCDLNSADVPFDDTNEDDVKSDTKSEVSSSVRPPGPDKAGSPSPRQSYTSAQVNRFLQFKPKIITLFFFQFVRFFVFRKC